MSDTSNNQRWVEEFSEFLASDSASAPREIGEALRRRIDHELNPNPWQVFAKLSLIQVIVGAIVLLFCPQFGVGLTSSHGIMPWLMQYGEGPCMFGCGALFVGSSLFISAFLLRAEEVRVLRQNRVLQTVLLSLLTVGAFLCLGAQVLGVLTLAWLAGSVLGGMATLEVGWAARRWIRTKGLYA